MSEFSWVEHLMGCILVGHGYLSLPGILQQWIGGHLALKYLSGWPDKRRSFHNSHLHTFSPLQARFLKQMGFVFSKGMCMSFDMRPESLSPPHDMSGLRLVQFFENSPR